MKLVTFAHDGLARLGAVVGNEVVDGSAAPGLPRDMLGFLEAGRSALDGLARLIESGGGGSQPHRHRSGSRARALQAAACTYRIALGPRAGQKVLSLQTVPTAQPTPGCCASEQGFSLHAEVCCAAHQRKKLGSQAQGRPLPTLAAATLPVPPSLTSALRSTGPGRWCSP